jgi:transposase
MARTVGSGEQNERKRRRAIEIVLRQQRTQLAAAKELKVHLRTVQRWVGLYRRHGDVGIRSKKATGRPKKLRSWQLNRLQAALLRGPSHQGYGNDLWTSRRILQLVEKLFGISYHHNHIPKLLRSMGWSAQRPQRQAVEKDAEQIERWIRVEWKRIKKKPEASKRP